MKAAPLPPPPVASCPHLPSCDTQRCLQTGPSIPGAHRPGWEPQLWRECKADGTKLTGSHLSEALFRFRKPVRHRERKSVRLASGDCDHRPWHMTGRATGRNWFLLLVTVNIKARSQPRLTTVRMWGAGTIHTRRRGPVPNSPGLPDSRGKHWAVVMSCIQEHKLENATEYLLKEKLSNNSVPDLLLWANNSAHWKG